MSGHSANSLTQAQCPLRVKLSHQDTSAICPLQLGQLTSPAPASSADRYVCRARAPACLIEMAVPCAYNLSSHVLFRMHPVIGFSLPKRAYDRDQDVTRRGTLRNWHIGKIGPSFLEVGRPATELDV